MFLIHHLTGGKWLFTDTAATKLWQLYEDNQKQKEKTLAAFFDWLDKDGMAIFWVADRRRGVLDEPPLREAHWAAAP